MVKAGVKSAAGLTAELKWLGWDRAGPQAFSSRHTGQMGFTI